MNPPRTRTRRGRRSRAARAARVPLAAVVAGALLAAVGCSGSGSDGGTGRPAGAPGASAAAQAGVPAAGRQAPAPAAVDPARPAADTCGNAELSLKPPSAVPTKDSWPKASWMEAIVQRGHIIVGVDQSSYPFGYLDPVSNSLKGFDIDLLRRVAKAVFGPDSGDERIRFRVLRNADRVPAVERGEVDIVAMTMTVNCDRRARVDFSDIYFLAGQRALVQLDPDLPEQAKQGLPGLAGFRVCAVNGSTSLGRIKDPKYNAKPVEGETWADCLVKLQKGETDAISTDDTILAGLQAQDPKFTAVVGERISREPYGMAISKEHPEFVRFVNAVLAETRRDGTWRKLYDTHIGTALGTGDAQPPAVTAWRDAS
ncbi:glutamate ABC transporter substrate-binding protein [Yinghuangia soli]|uniref:Glutamate ABC transporter substrate-binding protein n=1 Tax=Yinghuangia soli TaxID=2908204 RepID=A0AA41TYA2_9ACTN|nr:glutamate ABC transporter substrate-binding protein [Yinghuangia soli]MCF2526171.1 glutamate ABC transporter substrate-binding protein [Yinghuangia soli]